MILNEAQQQIRDMARDFARERLAPGASARDRESRFPKDELKEMGELGFLGMLVSEDYGGSETGAVAYALALEEIAAGDGACSTIMSVHNSVGCVPILKFGTEEQKQRFLPKLASGEWIGGFALTEPQAGSDASNLKTKARRDGDRYIIDGAKQFITSGKNGDVIIVFAITDPAAGKKGITAFIVPTDTPGYEVIRVEEKLGLHSSDTCQIAFTDMAVPAELRLGEEGQGIASRSPIWKAAASVSPRRRSAWRRPLSRRRGIMPASARPSGKPSSSIRRWRFGLRIWRRGLRRRGSWCCMRRR